jgi:hypothetical protein
VRSILDRLNANPERKGQVGGSHYKDMAIQPMEYNYVNHIPYIDGNIIKYVSRWRSKGGLDDLKKAKHYLDYLIAGEEARLGPDEVNRPGTPEDGGHHWHKDDV